MFGIFNAVFVSVSVVFAGRIAPEGRAATLQGLLSVCVSTGGVLGNVLGGLGSQYYSISWTMLFFALAALVLPISVLVHSLVTSVIFKLPVHNRETEPLLE